MSNKIEIRADDLVNAVALYKANRSGFYGSANTTAEEIGNMAGVTTDVKEAEVLYQGGEISREDYKERIKQVALTGAMLFIDRAIDRGLDVVQFVVTKYVPILAPIVPVVRSFVKQVIYKAGGIVIETAKGLFNWIKKKLFS